MVLRKEKCYVEQREWYLNKKSSVMLRVGTILESKNDIGKEECYVGK
jgi:hypothetical protein